MHRLLAILLCLAPSVRGQDVHLYAMGPDRAEVGAMLGWRHGFFGRLGVTYSTYRIDSEYDEDFYASRTTSANSGARLGLGIMRGLKGIDFGLDGYAYYGRIFSLSETEGSDDSMIEGSMASLGIEGSASIAFLERFRIGAFFNLLERHSQEITYPGYGNLGEGKRRTNSQTGLSSDLVPAFFVAVKL